MFNRFIRSIFGTIIIGSIVWTTFGQSETALTISYIVSAFTFLVLVIPGGKGKKSGSEAPHEKPAGPKELSFAGKVRGVIGLILLGSAVCIGLWYAAVSQLGPTPNPAAIPSDCDRIKSTIGAPQSAKCPITKDPVEWEKFVSPYIEALTGENWPKKLIIGLLRSCPSVYIRAKEEPKCQLDIGTFSKEYDQYLNSKNAVTNKRLNFDPTAFLQALAFVGLLAALTTAGLGIAISSFVPERTGMKQEAKKWLGKLGADTIFVICLLIWLSTDFQFLVVGKFDPRLKPAIESLIAVGFYTAVAIPFVGIFTAAIGFVVSEVLKFGKGAGVAVSIGTVVIAASAITFISGTVGQYPGWMYTIGIIQTMKQYPGLDLTLAINSVILGGIVFSGMVSTVLGPLWTGFSILGALIRALVLGEKLGMLPPRD